MTKRSTIVNQLLCSLLFLFLSLTTTGKGNRIMLSGDFSYSSKYKIKGGGYSLTYNTSLTPLLHFETSCSFSIMNGKQKRDDHIINQIQLLNLKSSSSSYLLYTAITTQVPFTKGINIELFAGPLASYQSSLITINDYLIIDYKYEGKNQGNLRVSEVETIEGLFSGVVGGGRINFKVGPSLQIYGQMKMEKVFKAISAYRSSIGVAYSW